jgi:hypothetical protein
MINECGAVGEMRIGIETKVLEQNPPVPLCPLQILYNLM